MSLVELRKNFQYLQIPQPTRFAAESLDSWRPSILHLAIQLLVEINRLKSHLLPSCS